MKIGLIGAGRLGICLALLLEKAGYDVIVSDCRRDYVIALNNREIITNEPEVVDLLKSAKNFIAVEDNSEVIKQCDLIFTLVATPSLPTGDYDVSAVWQVVKDFQTAEFSVQGKTLIVGCTTNPGDCDLFQDALKQCGVNVFYNPEFIAQGSIIRDLQRADMVLIGGYVSEVYDRLVEMYRAIQVTDPKINFMSPKAAEIVKLATNCFLTTKISYANMLGEVMTLAGLEEEIETVLGAIGDDSRIGKKFLKYGYGYGGPCLPRDNRSFAAFSKKMGLKYNLGYTTDNFNDEHSIFLTNYFLKKNVRNLPFAFHYVSYKEGTDIITESQQYRLCLNLLNSGYKVYVVEDYVKSQCDDRIIFGIPNEEVFWIEL